MKDKLEQNTAFPTYNQQGNPACWNTEAGMSKRFYAACNILQGLMSNPDSEEYHLGDGIFTDSSENKVRLCYILADELLKQESE